MNRFRLPATLVLIALLVGACGSSKGTTRTRTTSADGVSNSTGDTNTGDKDLDALLKKSKNATYKVVYKTDNGEVTFINRPPASAFISDDTGLFQDADGNTTSCNGTGSEAECTQLPTGTGQSVTTMIQGLFGAYGALLTSNTANSLLGVDTSEREIAGRSAQCAKIDASKFGSAGSAEVCVDADLGIMLLISGTDGSGKRSSVLEATSVSTEPSEADVTPPATPQTLPSFTIPTFSVPTTSG